MNRKKLLNKFSRISIEYAPDLNKKTLDPKTRFDKDVSMEKADEMMKILSTSGVSLKWGDVAVAMEVSMLEEVRQLVKNRPVLELAMAVPSLIRSMEKFAEVFSENKFSKEEADNAMNDLRLLVAIKERLEESEH